MRIEWLVAFYMFVSFSMIVFNFAFLINGSTHARSLRRRGIRLAAKIERIMKDADGRPGSALAPLERIMQSLSGLEAFNSAMEHLETEDPERLEQAQKMVEPILDRLASLYGSGSVLRCAYYSYIVRRWYPSHPAHPQVVGSLLKIVRTNSLYARQSALTALAEVGTAESLVNAAIGLGAESGRHHPKLVTEALLAFWGDRSELADRLIERFDEFCPEMQAAVINFGRMADIDHTEDELYERRREWIRGMMNDESLDMELRLSCVRYFTRHPWDGAAGSLRAFAEDGDLDKWEYAAVAASALARYPGEETVRVLKQCLSSAAWYVRFNAAKSLCDMGLTLDDLRDVLEGGDRYARDMVVFRWQEDRGDDRVREVSS